ncbi:MAG: transaldolase [Chloroflexota bacterium]|nr:transaldolase [Chloroflexota bacterium]
MPRSANLLALKELGQSVWYDNISRELLVSGGLKEILDWGVVGLTSNPSIFEKAISSSQVYDSAIQNMELETFSDIEVFEKLAVADIQDAADLLADTYKKTDAKNGYVSLEVNPHLANDTDKTVAEAERLYKEVGRPNLMIKVPATESGIPAIQQLISKGISVNVTLIFSTEMYSMVREAYLSGLENLHVSGADLSKTTSVASFFVSRVDTAVDSAISQGKLLSDDFKGMAGIANAKIAYKEFQDTFASSRFEKLRAAGANIQRPLWASTSMKNPAMRDVLYVENLVGPDTVNTMPDVTLNAFIDHGNSENTITKNVDDAYNHISALTTAGIDMSVITQTLLEDGVKAFADSFDQLLENISQKRSTLAATR